MPSCEYCSVPALKKCGGCSLVFYCTREHQKADWKKSHQKICQRFEIKKNDVLGRYAVATRDIRAGEIILKEKFAVLAPKIRSEVVCLGCHKNIFQLDTTKDFLRCRRCTWPICSETCENSPMHVDECRLMSSRKFKSSIKNTGNVAQLETCYCLIMPLRVVILKQKNPDIYNKINELVSHLKERSNTDMYKAFKQNIVPFIRVFLGLTEFTDDDILRICAILDTNTFSVKVPTVQVSGIRGIYFNAAMMAHECIPNTKHYINSDMEMVVISSIDIKKGEMITTSYTTSLKTTIERRHQLKIAKCFDCICRRCSDNTELSTYSSSLKCQKCDMNGLLVSKDPLNNLSNFSCNKCNYILSAKDYIQTTNSIRQQVNKLNRKSGEDCEEFLINNKNLLPEKSVFIVDVKYVLCMIYGNILNYTYKDLSNKIIARKIELCLDLLDVFNIIEPGCSNLILNVEYELNAAKLAELSRKSNSSENEIQELKDKYFDQAQLAAKKLKESSENKTLEESRTKVLSELYNMKIQNLN